MVWIVRQLILGLLDTNSQISDVVGFLHTKGNCLDAWHNGVLW